MGNFVHVWELVLKFDFPELRSFLQIGRLVLGFGCLQVGNFVHLEELAVGFGSQYIQLRKFLQQVSLKGEKRKIYKESA